MASISNWVRYMAHKLEYSLTLSLKNHTREKLSERELIGIVWKNLFYGRITYLHSGKGQEMAPTMGTNDNTLLVRKLPYVDTRYVFVGDAVVLKDPNETNKYLVRRLAALEGSEMISSDEKDEPFVLEKDQCWVVAENKEIKPKEAYDSRTFGPVSMSDIVGRAIYCLRTAVDHGPVSNSEFAMEEDSPILAVELNVDEMAKDHKA
uniref:Mitochondrial inner membrane protease subunit 1 n=1 Tax=Noccaea caerulescens TaxID=107243 RepID=A0A1J3F2K4_NOCCA